MATDATGRTPSPTELADRVAIAEVLYLHSRGLDRLDSEILKRAYWPEAEVDYGSFRGPAHSFAELVTGALAGQYELTRHCLSNTVIALDGSTARSESCVTAAHLYLDAQREMLFHGRYLDRLEKRGEHWKILHRQVVMDWSREMAVEDARASQAFAALAKGAHRDADPLYPFLQADA